MCYFRNKEGEKSYPPCLFNAIRLAVEKKLSRKVKEQEIAFLYVSPLVHRRMPHTSVTIQRQMKKDDGKNDEKGLSEYYNLHERDGKQIHSKVVFLLQLSLIHI
eukprot:TRINITY_DN3419_c0_g1_i3.p1 TRINITY_DN3419_c0_g1~~TRINITY_DN3419_c0_g1_i3.p1  ORF type:complete len:104 (+),score=4.64 TRINITY_DN3419_c0_g1_i3:286-597(+)